MDTDRNLLFGVLALQAELLDNDRFAEACAAWTARRDTPLADLLVERGWLTPQDRSDVERLLERTWRKDNGGHRPSLAAAADAEVRRTLAGLQDSAVDESLARLAGPNGQRLVTTVDQLPEMRERYTLTRLHAKGGLGQVWLAR